MLVAAGTCAVAGIVIEHGTYPGTVVLGLARALTAAAVLLFAAELVTMHCKALGVKAVYAEALSPMQATVLERVGADHVDLPEGSSLRRLTVPEGWDGRSLAELRLLGVERLGIVQVVRRADAEGEREKVALPHGETILHAGDEIDAIGPDGVLDKFSWGCPDPRCKKRT